MANLTQTALPDAVKTQYERRLLTRAVPRLPHGKFGMVARLNKMGAYELRKYGSLSAMTTALTEGTTPAEQAVPTASKVTITPLFYGAWIGYTDELDMTTFDPIVSEIAGILGEQCGVSIDTLIRDTITAGATKDYSANQTARGNLDSPQHDITYADFVKQIAALEGENAMPISGDNFAVIMHPHTFATLMQDPVFVNLFLQEAERTSPAIRTYRVGSLLRCDIFVSSNSRKYADTGAGGTTDVYDLLFIAREAYGYVGMVGITPEMVDNMGPGYGNMTGAAGKRASPVELIMKPLGFGDDPLNQRGSVAWKASLGMGMTNALWIRSCEHTNVFSDD